MGSLNFDPIELVPLKVLEFLRGKFENLILSFSGGSDSTLLLLYMLHYNIFPDFIITARNPLLNPSAKRYILKIKQMLARNKYSIPFLELETLDTKQLFAFIKQDYLKNLNKRYDKSLFRCCRYLKKKPFQEYIKHHHKKEKENTVILLGIRLYDSRSRFRIAMQLIKNGQFYFIEKKYAYESWPLMLINDTLKNKLLKKLTKYYNLPMPPSSFCYICPIYYIFAKGEEKKTKRYRANATFFNKVMGQAELPAFL